VPKHEVDLALRDAWFQGQAKPAVERALLMLNNAGMAEDETVRALASQDLLMALRLILETDSLSLNQSVRAVIADAFGTPEAT
jgi:hypothetical protein